MNSNSLPLGVIPKITLVLTAVCLSLLVGCGGGGNGGGGGGQLLESNRLTLPEQVNWTISPFNTGLSIEWHNLAVFQQVGSLQLVHLNLTIGGVIQERAINITHFMDGVYRIDGLMNGTGYGFPAMVELEFEGDRPSLPLPIEWLWEQNRLDRNNIVVGENYDGDGRADLIDTDDDNDRVMDDHPDKCPRGGELNWISNKATDFDGDGCRDEGSANGGNGEDTDDDNDGVDDRNEEAGCRLADDCDNDDIGDMADSCPKGVEGWQSDSTLDTDNDGCRDRDEDDDLVGVTGLRPSLTNFPQLELHWDNPAVAIAFFNISWEDTNGGMGWVAKRDDLTNGFYAIDGLAQDLRYEFKVVVHYMNGGVSSRQEQVELLFGSDSDNDSHPNIGDNCPFIANEDQLNTDGDTEGDACDKDDDNDGHEDGEDVDDDGDGLIEIATAKELDEVRYVLNGTGRRSSDTAALNSTGCGDGVDMIVCNGYELVNDISLADYIATTYPTNGWLSIAHDTDSNSPQCVIEEGFSGIFEGNGFIVSDLRINRPLNSCLALFGLVDGGTIRNIGILVREISGESIIGGLVGSIISGEIINSYAVNGMLRVLGNPTGGLVGSSRGTKIINSYAVTSIVSGPTTRTGGLVGQSSLSTIVNSYVVIANILDGGAIGGLVGETILQLNTIVNSYVVIGFLGKGTNNFVGGLVGRSSSSGIKIIHSYALSGAINAATGGGLVGDGGTVIASYWNNETSGRNDDTATGSSGHNSLALYSPTDFTGLYDTWDDGAMVDNIDDNITIWCDEDATGMIEDDEKRGDSHTNGDNRVWDLGTNTEYPAIRCTPDSLADQRAWWYLNTTSNKPQLNRTRVNAYLDGTL